MSISSKKMVVSVVAAALAARAPARSPRTGTTDRTATTRIVTIRIVTTTSRYEQMATTAAYDYARVVDVQPLVTRVRVTHAAARMLGRDPL